MGDGDSDGVKVGESVVAEEVKERRRVWGAIEGVTDGVWVGTRVGVWVG